MCPERFPPSKLEQYRSQLYASNLYSKRSKLNRINFSFREVCWRWLASSTNIKPDIVKSKLTVTFQDQVFWLNISVNDLLLVDVLKASDETCYKETYTDKQGSSLRTIQFKTMIENRNWCWSLANIGNWPFTIVAGLQFLGKSLASYQSYLRVISSLNRRFLQIW